MLKAAAYSVGGEKTSVNQDAVLTRMWDVRGEQVLLMVLADGLGGYQDGQESAWVILDEVVRCCDGVLSTAPVDPVFDLMQELDYAIGRADARIKQTNVERSRESGSTVVLSLQWRERYIIKNIGDSRAYKINTETVEQLSEDHTALANALQQSAAEPGGERKLPGSHVLSRCVGMGDFSPPFSMQGVLQKGECILLCSDGFYQKATWEEEKTMTPMLVNEQSEVFAKLTATLQSRGEKDDISLAVSCYSQMPVAGQPVVPNKPQAINQKKKLPKWAGILIAAGLAVVLAGTGLVVFLVQKSQDTSQPMRQAQEALEAGDYMEAATLYLLIIQDHPNDEQALRGLFGAYYGAGEWDMADGALNKLSRVYANNQDTEGERWVEQMQRSIEVMRSAETTFSSGSSAAPAAPEEPAVVSQPL